MIRKLTENDRLAALRFLSQEPAYNVFTIGDIENFGFYSAFQDVWADVDTADKIHVLILRYYDTYIIYAKTAEVNYDTVIEFFRKPTGKWILMGKEWLAERIARALEKDAIERHVLAQITDETTLLNMSVSDAVGWADDVTFEQVLELRRGIEEFTKLGDSTDEIVFNQKSGTGRTAVVVVDGTVVSCASSAAENSQSAMIIGVCTAKTYRHNGFATACMVTLCKALTAEGKTICLFYQNPDAARIYKKIGFRDIGRWAMVNMSGTGPYPESGRF